jgi:hypothetical protein
MIKTDRIGTFKTSYAILERFVQEICILVIGDIGYHDLKAIRYLDLVIMLAGIKFTRRDCDPGIWIDPGIDEGWGGCGLGLASSQ